MNNAWRYNGLWLVLFTTGAAAACASAEDTGDDDDTPSNKSGAAHAGSLNVSGSANNGGAPAAGGNSNGTSGSGTSNPTAGTTNNGTAGSGAGGGSGFACASTKPAAALITEFADLMPNPTNAGQFIFTLGTPGGTFAYQKTVFTLSDASKALKLTGNVKDFDGFGVYVGTCLDASSYDGVSFSIKGNAGPTGKLSFRFQTNGNMPIDTAGKKGVCVVPSGVDPYTVCHHATLDIDVKAEPTTIAVKFSDVTGGLPNATVNGKDFLGLEWAFPWTGATDTAYDVDVTLDDVKFTGAGPSGSGGAGGSGGGGGSGGTQ